ncbi:unnamed protein product [Moneuplotes crassus]|uniref:Uncharacterized protein n=1 Tax=Euplotes crassus TaxID=5936 RepID=A0AAD1UG95_EUPCR|nr:unnamed protein product [Moneuplotes crassus]
MELDEYKELKELYSSLINYNSDNEDNWTILTRIILDNPDFVKNAVRSARDELFHITANKKYMDRKQQQEEELKILRQIEDEPTLKKCATNRPEKFGSKRNKRKLERLKNLADAKKSNMLSSCSRVNEEESSMFISQKKEKSLHHSRHRGNTKRLFLKRDQKSKPNNEQNYDQRSNSPDRLRKAVSQKEIRNKVKRVSQIDTQKVKINTIKRGPFPSERLYDAEKIKSSQQSVSKLPSSRGRNNQDDSLYKYIGAPYDSSGIFKKDKRLKMPNLFKSTSRKCRKKFKNSLMKHAKYFEGMNPKSRLRSRVLSTSPQNNRNNTTGLLSPKVRNIGSQQGSPTGQPNKLSAYLIKVSNLVKLPKVENRTKNKRKPQVREKEKSQCTSQIIQE